MKVRKLLISALLLMAASPLCAAASPFTAGVEWGANAMVYASVDRNYIDRAGSRVDASSRGLSFYLNGTLRAFAGVYAGGKLRFDLGTGYIGLADSRREIPLTLRANYLAGGRNADGAVLFLDGGAGFSTVSSGVVGILGAAGAGYRMHMAEGSGLSFLFNLRFATDRPGIIYPDGMGFVPAGDIRNNAAEYLSAGISISVDF